MGGCRWSAWPGMAWHISVGDIRERSCSSSSSSSSSCRSRREAPRRREECRPGPQQLVSRFPRTVVQTDLHMNPLCCSRYRLFILLISCLPVVSEGEACLLRIPG